MAGPEALEVDKALERFGLRAFRPGQREVIETVLSGRNALCVMPTGGGKSLCYQLPALLLPSPTLVISPLIALMKDQEDQLLARNIRATALHSGISDGEQTDRLERIARREYDLIYVAPERFRSRRFLDAIGASGLSLLAVDEAHCISEWGHDFRPDYVRLGEARKRLGNPTTIALTATATDIVRRDIVDQLALDSPAVFIRGFDRPNLLYAVTPASTKAQKAARLRELVREVKGSLIIYCASRKNCEEVAELLRETAGRPITVYHAGMMPDERLKSQDRFMSGRAEIVVATNAFGMGIDKADIRAVVHYNVPGTLEAFYQEAGRAGRDGDPARCEMLFSAADRFIQEFFIDNEYPEPRLIYEVLGFLRRQNSELVELTRLEIKERMGIDASEMAVGACLKILEQSRILERLRPRQNMAIIRIHETGVGLDDRLPAAAAVQKKVVRLLERLVGDQRGQDCYFHPDGLAQTLGIERTALNRALHEICSRMAVDYIPPFRGSATRIIDRETPMDKLPIDLEAIRQRKRAEYDKLERVFDFAQLSACRRQALLSYFGERSEPCGNCDNCNRAGRRKTSVTEPSVGKGESAPLNADAQKVLRTVLEGVDELRGRFGKGLISQTLSGSSSKEISRFGLQNRSCFGKLMNFRQAEIGDVLEALLAAGLLRQQGEQFRPTLALAPQGQPFVDGVEQFPADLRLSPEILYKLGQVASGRPAPEATPAPRPQPSQTATTSPRPPLSPPSANAATEPRPREEKRAPIVQTQNQSPPVKQNGAAKPFPHYFWTAELLVRGYSVDDVAAIRRLETGIVVEHALAAAQAGTAIPWTPFQNFTGGKESRVQLELLHTMLSRS